MKLIDLEFNLRKHDLNRDMNFETGVYIINLKNTVNGMIKILKSQSGNPAYLPYYNTLFNIYQKLEDESKR